MAKQHVVTAPLVVTKGVDGADLYLYSGTTVPELAEGEADRLVDGGFVAEVEEPKAAAAKATTKAS